MCLKSKHLTPKSAKEKQNEENKTVYAAKQWHSVGKR